MGWIDDVRSELERLDDSLRSRRRFAFAVGGVLVLLGAWVGLRRHQPLGGGGLAAAGALLAGLGAFAPALLGPLHRAWMAMAFALGWVMSRVVLTALFFAAITPVALLARIAGKRFLELELERERPTYWERRDPARKVDYEKMY